MAKAVEKMSEQEIREELAAINAAEPKPVSKMSESEIKAELDFIKKSEQEARSKPSQKNQDILTLTGKHASMGLAPLAAGAGGYIGRAIGSLEKDEMLGDPGISDWISRLKAAHAAGKEGFTESRKEQIKAEDEATVRSPGINLATGLLTGLATSPLTAVRGATALGRIGYGTAMGMGLGAAQAAGHADSLAEAGQTIGTNALTGGLINTAPEIGRGAVSLGKSGYSAYKSLPEPVRDLAKGVVGGGIGYGTLGPFGGLAGAATSYATKMLESKAADMAQKFSSPGINADLWGTVGQAVKPAAKPLLEGLMSATPSQAARGMATYIGSDINATQSAMDRRRQKIQGK